MGAQVWESMACIVFLIGLDGEVGICQHFFMLTNLYWCTNSWCFLGNQCVFFAKMYCGYLMVAIFLGAWRALTTSEKKLSKLFVGLA